MLNLKDLLALLPSRCRATLSGFTGWLKRGEAYLLIPRGLAANWMRRTGEGMLNLKGLLTEFPPGLRHLFENEPAWKRHFCAESYQIMPFSAKTWRNMGKEWRFEK